jgi:pyridoxal phosphate enzyme (YggS family)
MHITKNLQDLKQRISAACNEAGRNENEVSILAVSKRHSADAIREAASAGLYCMGENYLQEALEKVPLFGPEIEWHFIGRIQSNKTKTIAENFQWVQTISTARVAERLSRQRPADMGDLNVCIQVDADNSGIHNGVRPEEAESLCEIIAGLPRLQLRGLMTIPLPTAGREQQRYPFRQLRALYAQLITRGYALDTLSMGMTDDLEAAVIEGSTMVRIGTALFGPRPL